MGGVGDGVSGQLSWDLRDYNKKTRTHKEGLLNPLPHFTVERESRQEGRGPDQASTQWGA